MHLPGDLLLYGLCVCLGEEREEAAAEIVRVAVGVAELVGHCIQQQVAACQGWGGEGRSMVLAQQAMLRDRPSVSSSSIICLYRAKWVVFITVVTDGVVLWLWR